MKRVLLVLSSLTAGLSELLIHPTQAEVIWNSFDAPKEEPSSVNWKAIPRSKNSDTSTTVWEVVPEPHKQAQPSSRVIWEVLKTQDEATIHTSKEKSHSIASPPLSLDEAESIADKIPLQSDDFKPLLNLSHAVPTALVVKQDEWRLISSTISPFIYANGTGNQNYAIHLNYGLSDTIQISGFYSEADDPLNSQIKGLEIRPANFWEVYGVSARWKVLTNKNWSFALNSSFENWTVGSGGNDSFGKSSNVDASPNIFNDSGKRVETQNLVGSISLPLTWHPKKKWQFTLAPGISFLPSKQGKGQGGAGEFYGTNPYVSGGFLWHPIPEIGITTSIAQPVGSGTNNFDRNLEYSRVPVISGGLNLHLNPRIAFQGQLTNGFGATPATALLTLPSDNRLGYSVSFAYIADALDTPQTPLSPMQKSLSLGGITVNTALVPPDTTKLSKISADSKGNFDSTLGFSISNIFYLDFYRSEYKNIPQTNIHALTYASDSAISWRGSGKVIFTSPLRGSSIWSALRISFGRSIDEVNNTANGYLFAETPLTWEANSKTAININPKLAWAGVGNLWGVGISSNIEFAPGWELVPEAIIVMNSQKGSNGTLGVRWNATNTITIEAYATTASSIIDIGQLLNANEIRWGSRLSLKF